MLNYVLTEQFDLPNGYGLIESCPDGRLVLVGVDQLLLEDTPGSRTFSPVDAPTFGAPSFFRLSPFGTKAAAGNYQQDKVFFFDFPFTSGGSVTEVIATSYDAEWLDEEWLGVSNQGGDGIGGNSVVTMIRSTDGDLREIISAIPGASGGVSFDADSNLYTGIGFAGPNNPDTGLINPDYSRGASQIDRTIA